MTRRLVGRVVREKRVVILALALLLAVNAAVAALVVYPRFAQVQAGEETAAAAAAAMSAAERDFQAASGTMAGKTRAMDDLKRFYSKVLPTDLAGARRATYLMLSKLAQDAQLRTQRRAEDVEEPRLQSQSTGDSLTRFGITMVLRGNYENVRQFLRDVEASGAFLIIDNVALAEGTEPGSALVLTVELSTYYRTANHGT